MLLLAKRITAAALAVMLIFSMLPVTVLAETEQNSIVASGTCGTDLDWTLDSAGLLEISGTGFTDCYSFAIEPSPWYSYRNRIKRVIIHEGVTGVNNCAFYNCSYLTSVTIPYSCFLIGEYAFCDCTSLSSVMIPDTVTEIGAFLFNHCNELKSAGPIGGGYDIEFGWTKEIPDNAFSSCEGLADVTLPDTITSIGAGAFFDCPKLHSINIPEGVTAIENETFAYCESLSIVKIPDNVTYIGYRAFAACDDLYSVTIGNSTTFIDEQVFAYCPNLNIVRIPVSVTTIGDDAFKDCTSLKEVYYAGSEARWKDVSIGTNNSSLNNAQIIYEGTDICLEQAVCFLQEWDSQKQTAYFGSVDFTGSRITEKTAPEVLEIIDDLVGQYVLVEQEINTYDTASAPTILNMYPVESRMGITTAADNTAMTIDGTTYEVAADITLPEVYLNRRVLYHLYDGKIVGIEELACETGMLTFWNDTSRTVTIDPDGLKRADYYTLSPLVDDVSLEFLGPSGHTNVSVRYWRDSMRFVYAIEWYTPPESSSYYDMLADMTEDQRILANAAFEWESAFNNYIQAVVSAFGEMAGTEGALRDAAIASEADRMKKEDLDSNSKHINFNSNFPKQYKKYAYQALATLLYDSACQNPEFSSIDLSSNTATVQLVKSIYNSLYQTKKEYEFDNVTIYMNILQMGTAEFGSLTCSVTDPDSGKATDYEAVICSTRTDCEETVQAYLEELKDFAKTAEYNVYSAICTDILGKSLSSLTEDYLNSVVSDIEKKLAVKLSEKFNISGIGDMIEMLNTCHTYGSWLVEAAKAGSATELDQAVTKTLNLKFEDKTIESSGVKFAVKKMSKVAEYLRDLSYAYLAGESLEERETFWSVLINCPVRVAVFNSDGEQIGYVGEDDLWYTDAIMITEVAGAKKVTALTDDLLSIEIVGAGYGQMCCSFEEYSDAYTPLGRLNYYDIPIIPDRAFSVTLCEDLAANGDELAITSEGKTFYPDEYIDANDSACTIITCNAETDNGTVGGSVTGVGTYVRGDPVILQAVPDAGYQFMGWYIDDTLIGYDETFEFTAKERAHLTAKFSAISYVSVQVIAEEGGYVFGSSKYLPGDTAQVYAVPDTYKSFAGWYQNGRMVADTAEYQFTISDDTILTAKFKVHDHVYADMVTPPTCTQDGYTTYTCVCGDTYVGDYVEAAGHDYGDAGVVTAPTCTEDGYTTYTCICGYTYIGDYVEATGHDYGDAGVVTPPTCTKDGYTTYTCVCGDTYIGDYVEATGHDYGDAGVVTPPTCTEDGYTAYTCYCGAVKIRNRVDALGHIYDKWTYTSNGAEITFAYTCTRCKEVMPETGVCLEVDPAAGDTQAVLYTMDDFAWKYIDIPQSYTMALQLQADDSAYWSVVSGDSVTVSNTGLITPKITTWYWYSSGSMYYGTTNPVPSEECVGITYEVEYGTSVVRVVSGGKKYDLTVEVRDYCEVYTDAVIDAYIAENIMDSMSVEEKMDAICRFPASYDYSPDISTASGMILCGGGDCWASTSLILAVCEKLGIEAVARNGNRDPGGGSGHENALITIKEGDYYELDAGYEGNAPREYHVKHRTSLYCYTSTSGGITVYQYDGEITEDTVLTVPETIDSKTVVAIEDQCFLKKEMRKIILPDTLIKIGEQAFAGCKNLKTIHLPASVTNVGELAFADCLALQEFTCDANNGTYMIQGGVLYSEDLTTLYEAPACSTVTIPQTVDCIARYAFAHNTNIEEIVFPESVKTLSYCALYKCSNLKRVTLKAVENIADGALSSYNDLLVYFEGDAPEFATNAFYETTVNAYYPNNQTGWAKKIHQQYGGTVNWKSYTPGSPLIRSPEIKVGNAVSTGKPMVTWEPVEGAVKYEVYRATKKTGSYSRESTTAATTYTNTGAVTGKYYYYFVRAYDAIGNYADSNIVGRTCDLAQTTVTLSNVASTGKIKISWEAVEGATKYEVYRATSKSGTYSRISTTGNTSVTNTKAEAGKTYYYKVRAICDVDAATAAYSSVKYRTCDLAQTTVTLSNVASTGKIKISWEAVEGATKYEIYRATSKTGTYSRLTTVTGTSATNTKTDAGKTYYYKVRALCDVSAAASAYSEVKSRTCDLPRPSVSISLSSGKPKVSWGKVEGAVSYKIYRATSKTGTYSLVKTTTSLSYRNSGATAGEIYYYKVVAVCSNTAGNSAYSSIVYIKSK